MEGLKKHPTIVDDLNKWLENTGYSKTDDSIKEAVEEVIEEKVEKQKEVIVDTTPKKKVKKVDRKISIKKK